MCLEKSIRFTPIFHYSNYASCLLQKSTLTVWGSQQILITLLAQIIYSTVPPLTCPCNFPLCSSSLYCFPLKLLQRTSGERAENNTYLYNKSMIISIVLFTKLELKTQCRHNVAVVTSNFSKPKGTFFYHWHVQYYYCIHNFKWHSSLQN